MDNPILPHNIQECTLCHRAYPATPEFFHRDRRGKYGLVARCKACVADFQRYYLKTESGKDSRRNYKQSSKGRASAKRYRSSGNGKVKQRAYQSTPERKAKQKVIAQKHRQSPTAKAKAIAYKRQYRTLPEVKRKRQDYNRSDGYKKSASKYRQSEQGQLTRKGINSRYRTAKTSAGGTYTAEQFKHLCEYYDNSCACCRKCNVPLEADHVLPVSKGGTSDITNIQPLCRTCNASKGRREIDYRYKGLPEHF